MARPVVGCAKCGHDQDAHTMAAPADPLHGGVMLCPDCPCWGTFSVDRRVEPMIPYCGFCGTHEHRPYKCPVVNSREAFDQWRRTKMP